MNRPTYRQEIERGQGRLEEFLQSAVGEDWEKVTDSHQQNIYTHGVYSDHLNGYVAEVVRPEGSADYMAMADPGFGRRVADLLAATLVDLDEELNVSDQHETCDRRECSIGAAAELVRYIGRKDQP